MGDPGRAWLDGIENAGDLEAQLERAESDVRGQPGTVGQLEADANPFSGYDPEGGVSRLAADLHREIVDAQNRMTEEAGSEFMRAAYEAFAASRQYDLLKRFARETSHALQDLTAPDAISKTVIVLREEIERPGGDPHEKREQLKALESIETLFRAEYADPTTDAFPGPSSD